MNYLVATTIEVKTIEGDMRMLSPGQVISLGESKALKLLKTGKIKPIKSTPTPMTDERRMTFLDCMTATWETIANPIYKKGFDMTPEIKALEMTIERIQDDVLEGKAKLEGFRNGCLAWEAVVKLAATRHTLKHKTIG